MHLILRLHDSHVTPVSRLYSAAVCFFVQKSEPIQVFRTYWEEPRGWFFEAGYEQPVGELKRRSQSPKATNHRAGEILTTIAELWLIVHVRTAPTESLVSVWP
jgi:hypothetical protein